MPHNPTFVAGGVRMYGSASGSDFGSPDDAETANEVAAQVVEDAYVLPIVDSQVVTMISQDLASVQDNRAFEPRAMYNIAEWGIRDN